jgi:hypothetical protein
MVDECIAGPARTMPSGRCWGKTLDFDTTIFCAIFGVEVYGRAEAMRMHNVYQVMNAQSILRAWRSKMHALGKLTHTHEQSEWFAKAGNTLPLPSICFCCLVQHDIEHQ